MKKINNVPEWAWARFYIVARYSCGEWWFFDAWEDDELFLANSQAWEVNGEVFKVSECERAE